YLQPEVGRQSARGTYATHGYFNENTSQENAKLHMMRFDLRGSVPVFQNEHDEWLVTGRVKLLDIDTSARLQREDSAFPGHLWDVNAGLVYRHKFDNGWIAGGEFSFGSASDEPFASGDEIVVSATGFLRIPHGESNAWLFFLNYFNNRQFLPDLPIPGFGYEINAGSSFSALAGVPFTWVRWEPIDRLSLEASYILPRRVRAQIGYRILESLKVYAGYAWDNERFLRHDRNDDDDRLFYFEQRVSAGVRWDILESVWLDFSGGFAFDRFFFEGEDYGDRGDDRLDVGDGPFLMLQVGVEL
ncbi:MAG: hypothetical protein JXB13_02990, partial [Phycisphaerae bacterium]|nr:hypothetical protein [Phycisphaerae bacterium]